MQTLGHSASALGGYLSLNEFLSQGTLSAKDRERIALTVAEHHGCGYCLAAHTAIGKMNGFSDSAILELRAGNAPFDSKLDALAKFAKSVAENRGAATQETVENFYAAGYTKGSLADVIVQTPNEVIQAIETDATIGETAKTVKLTPFQ